MKPLIHNPQTLGVLKHLVIWLGETALWRLASNTLGRRNERIVVEVRVSCEHDEEDIGEDVRVYRRRFE